MHGYNGFTGAERLRKYQVYKQRQAQGLGPFPVGPCQLCADPTAAVEPHSEDYATPYQWEPPAEYMICRSCHGWVHQRFAKPDAWGQFLAHVARGGYAREFAQAPVTQERKAAARAMAEGAVHTWAPIAGRAPQVGGWWTTLTLDEDSLTDPAARPRP